MAVALTGADISESGLGSCVVCGVGVAAWSLRIAGDVSGMSSSRCIGGSHRQQRDSVLRRRIWFALAMASRAEKERDVRVFDLPLLLMSKWRKERKAEDALQRETATLLGDSRNYLTSMPTTP